MAESGSLHRTYNCALVDMSDGSFELVRSLRAAERRTGIQRLPVLVSVAYGTDDWERRYLDAGINGHFLKPCSKDVILGRIGDTISAVNALVSIHEDSVSQGSSTDGFNVESRSSESAFKQIPETPRSGDRSVQ
jgi:DNA-binding NarL/FixJ family response regulator